MMSKAGGRTAPWAGLRNGPSHPCVLLLPGCRGRGAVLVQDAQATRSSDIPDSNLDANEG